MSVMTIFHNIDDCQRRSSMDNDFDGLSVIVELLQTILSAISK